VQVLPTGAHRGRLNVLAPDLLERLSTVASCLVREVRASAPGLAIEFVLAPAMYRRHVVLDVFELHLQSLSGHGLAARRCSCRTPGATTPA
jgi:hypothetical protein